MPRPLKIDPEGNITIQINLMEFLKIFLILAFAFGTLLLPIEGITPASRFCLVLFILAAGLWITAVIPPFATGILVMVLSIYVLGLPGGLLGLDSSGYTLFLNPISSPVLALFFGGLVLAMGATKHGLDVRIAKAFLKPFGTKPANVLLAIILITVFFSMFMSNTATTAMMIAIMTPILTQFEGREFFKKAMVLAIPFAANIGGVGTVIGSPPNAVAVSVLATQGIHVSFFHWMVIGLPFALIMSFILWVVFLKVFKPQKEEFNILFPQPLALTWDLLVVVIAFALTLLLWLTEPLHKIPSAVVALIPVLMFSLFGIINANDLKKLDWDVMILIAGGMVLGVAMVTTGLSEILVSYLELIKVPVLVMLCFVVLVTTVISNFMSNTSAANILIPIVVVLADADPFIGVLAVAFACSMAMSLPISTPPNAIAFATHAIETKEMFRNGTIISLIGVVMIWGLITVLKYVF